MITAVTNRIIWPAKVYSESQQLVLPLAKPGTVGINIQPFQAFNFGNYASFLNVRRCIGFQVLCEQDIAQVQYPNGVFEPVTNASLVNFTLTLQAKADPGTDINKPVKIVADYPISALFGTQNRIVTFKPVQLDALQCNVVFNGALAAMATRMPLAIVFFFEQPLTPGKIAT